MTFALDHIENPVSKNVLRFFLTYRDALLQDHEVHYVNTEDTAYAPQGAILSEHEFNTLWDQYLEDEAHDLEYFERVDAYNTDTVDWISDQVYRLLLSNNHRSYLKRVDFYQGWDEGIGDVVRKWETGVLPEGCFSSDFIPSEVVLVGRKQFGQVGMALVVFDDYYDCAGSNADKMQSWDEAVSYLVSAEDRLRFIDAYEHDDHGIKRYTWHRAVADVDD